MYDQNLQERFKSYFEEKCEKVTPLQLEICRQVAAMHDHFTEEEMSKKSREKFPDLKKGAVRETIQEMIRAGLIRKIYFGEGHVYFEHVWGHLHHDHLWCVECQKVVEFRDDHLEHIQEKIAKENDFLILRHNMQIIGLCNQCKDKASKYNLEYHDRYLPGPARPLATVSDGQTVVIEGLLGGWRMRHRLTEMGFVKGEKISVVQNRFAGSFIIDLKGTRLAVNHKIAHHVLVQDPEKKSDEKKSKKV